MQEMDRFVQQPVMGPKVNEVINDTVNPAARVVEGTSDSSLAEVSWKLVRERVELSVEFEEF